MSLYTIPQLQVIFGAVLVVILVVFLDTLHFLYHDLISGLLYNIFIQGTVVALGVLIVLSFWSAYDEMKGGRS
jgi:hypothetical protein